MLGVPTSEFASGGTRNRGISDSRGRLVVMTAPHALPADELWLQGLVENLANDEGI